MWTYDMQFSCLLSDDEDVFQCGRCKREFTNLTTFLNHKQTQCIAVSAKDNGNKTGVVVSAGSGDQTLVSSSAGQGFIYTAQLTQATNKQVTFKNCWFFQVICRLWIAYDSVVFCKIFLVLNRCILLFKN